MTPEEREEFRKMMESDAAKDLAKRVEETAQITKTKVAAFSYSLASTVGALPSKTQMAVISLQQATLLLPEAAPYFAGLISGVTLLSTPLFFLGVASLLATGVELTIGSSVDRLFSPLSVLLSQRLLLGLEGINVA
eukprot:CAMPEP_0201484188 /NCGR_PEP_ID=MMETSP0151_2-20130828/8385_1 /ASSEMBLY_ACC=CAM_ASM_000257 /TAXON_ID=200890 /ORGANISM="Paramoeba atlantica, Strain 621/1 / CCAP 1560/9" /LENGTH=135 /DNA_ID=CAMNT_0047867731 /DNA_START=1082 /DNA_END=1485 /DNA_ORIENTATION=+